ncbi:MAG: heme ABC transporter permease [Rhodobiaceae bacterium]|nr:heme ABC transporter permease [Rhodobiaceae bacterium]MCC0041273.1 heme ABC transporter permease [Rhodobiaceae bacterium]
MGLTDLANPTRFMSYSARIIPWLWALAVLVLGFGLYMALVVSPEDYQQGATVRIMYIHVPAAYMGMGAYTLIAISSIGTLVWRHPLADVSARAAAPIGAAFTFVALVTGSLWGKPMWGAWWVWDARLTSVLVLFLMYLGLIALWRAFDDPARGARIVAILALVGFVNIPIIKYSVEWWNTLHQPASLMRRDGPSMPPSMLVPLLVMLAGVSVLFVAMHLSAMRNEVLRRRVRAMQITAARAAATAGA